MCFYQVSEANPTNGRETYAYLQFSRLFKLLIVTLAFQATICGKHDILDIAVDIFLPGSQPGNFVIMTDTTPLVALWGRRNGRSTHAAPCPT